MAKAFRGSHRVRLEVGLEHLPLGVVDALGLLEEARHEVREEGLEVDGRHVEHARRDLLPQLARAARVELDPEVELVHAAPCKRYYVHKVCVNSPMS